MRQLLERYGILFRELLQHELPAFRWGALFRTLRLMELSGEILAGCFFEGVPGLQFIAPSAFRSLQQAFPEDDVYWLNATDPASMCGVSLAGLKTKLPKRVPTTHLVYHGSELVLISRRSGKTLDIHVPPEHPRLPDYLAALSHLLSRRIQPLSSITVERINKAPAPESPYMEALGRCFETDVGPKAVTIWRKTVGG